MVAICKRNSCSVLGAWRSYVIIMNLLETLSEVTHMCYQSCEAARKLACSDRGIMGNVFHSRCRALRVVKTYRQLQDPECIAPQNKLLGSGTPHMLS